MRLLGLLKLLIFIPIAYWWCDIHPGRNYDWLDGMWHGINFIGNFVLSIFSDAIVKSSRGTIGYNISWWLIVGLTLLNTILAVLMKIGLLKFDDKNEPNTDICEEK